MVPSEMSYPGNIHVEYQSSSIHCSKVISKLKFQRGGQNDRPGKINMPLDLRSRGHKSIKLHMKYTQKQKLLRGDSPSCKRLHTFIEN